MPMSMPPWAIRPAMWVITTTTVVVVIMRTVTIAISYAVGWSGAIGHYAGREPRYNDQY